MQSYVLPDKPAPASGSFHDPAPLCCEFLKEDADLSVFDVSVNEKIYDIGLILFDYVPEKTHFSICRSLIIIGSFRLDLHITHTGSASHVFMYISDIQVIKLPE